MASSAEVKAWAKRDAAMAQAAGDRSSRVGRSGQLAFSASMEAVMNAVNTEGPEVMSAAASGYWEDMRRRYPWTDPRQGHRAASPTRMFNRLGRVKERIIYHGNGRRTVLEASS